MSGSQVHSAFCHVRFTGAFSNLSCQVHRYIRQYVMSGSQVHSAFCHVMFAGTFSILSCQVQVALNQGFRFPLFEVVNGSISLNINFPNLQEQCILTCTELSVTVTFSRFPPEISQIGSLLKVY